MGLSSCFAVQWMGTWRRFVWGQKCVSVSDYLFRYAASRVVEAAQGATGQLPIQRTRHGSRQVLQGLSDGLYKTVTAAAETQNRPQVGGSSVKTRILTASRRASPCRVVSSIILRCESGASGAASSSN
ncbi:hypothetical protein EV363DRAFT_887295 [Boletus edulis]|nr:hypothetical protein EV363DRAFT_887295 [Boletus edulis]